MFQSQQAAELSSFGHLALALESRVKSFYVPVPASTRTQQLSPCGFGFTVKSRRENWDNGGWSAGDKKLAVIKKRPSSLK